MKFIFKVLFILLLLTCLNISSQAQSNVWISGKLLTDQKEGSTGILNNNVLNFKPSTIITQTIVDNSGNFKFDFLIPEPMMLQIFNKTFYISPGDSIYMNVSGSRYTPEKFTFNGRNANNYIFALKYDSLERSLQFKFPQYDFKNGLDNYLSGLNTNKTILLNFLNDFSKLNKLTDDCKANALSKIIYNYYFQLLYPLTSKKYPIEQVPSSYSALLDQIKLTDNGLVENSEYIITAKFLLRYKMLKYKVTELQVINDNFTGLTKELLLTLYASRLISNYISKDSVLTKELFDKVEAGINSPKFRKYLMPFKDQFNKYLVQLPKEVLLTTLMDSVGNKFTFKDLMEKSKNKFVVLDFWASWCSACIQGMPGVTKLKNTFSKAEVEFVFISLDKTEKDWRGGLKNTKIPGNHYWIADNFNSALVKYLIIPSIPRYVIMNKAGNFEKLNVSSPIIEENGLEVQLSKLLSH